MWLESSPFSSSSICMSLFICFVYAIRVVIFFQHHIFEKKFSQFFEELQSLLKIVTIKCSIYI